MDFKEIKKKALELKRAAEEKTKQAIDYSAKKLSESSLTIQTKKELDTFIKRSANTKHTNKETGKTKTFSHRVCVMFGDEKSDFFHEALYKLPLLATKGFSQSTPIRLAKTNITGLDLKTYNITTLPSVLVFENKKLYKTISGKENIAKLVKSLNLDINKTIDTL